MPRSSSSDGDTPLDEKQATRTMRQQDPEKQESHDAGRREAIQPTPKLGTNAPGAAGLLNRVLNRISTDVSLDPGPPPDGGVKAWLMCFCGHLIVMNSWGFINSFGVFQSYYTDLLKLPPSDISWIGSITIFLALFIGTFTGRLVDAGFLIPVVAVGTAFMTLGIFATSAATAYWQLILAQGLTMGIGAGWLFCAAVTTVATYFSTKRSFAIGLSLCGSVSGGLIYPAMARQLLPTIGFAWTIRVMGFIMLASMAFVLVFFRSRVPPRRAGSLVEWAAFREAEYALYAVGAYLNFWGVYFAFYYIGEFSRSANVTPALSYVDSLNLLLIINGVGLVGRLPANHLADRYGPLTILAPFTLVGSVAQFAWMAVSTPAQLYVWTVFYAIAAGAIQSLFPAGLSSLTKDPQKQGTRIGMVFTIASFATLTGNPIAGAILAADSGRYRGAQAFTGVCLLLGAGCVFGAKVVRIRRTGGGWGTRI